MHNYDDDGSYLQDWAKGYKPTKIDKIIRCFFYCLIFVAIIFGIKDCGNKKVERDWKGRLPISHKYNIGDIVRTKLNNRRGMIISCDKYDERYNIRFLDENITVNSDALKVGVIKMEVFEIVLEEKCDNGK